MSIVYIADVVLLGRRLGEMQCVLCRAVIISFTASIAVIPSVCIQTTTVSRMMSNVGLQCCNKGVILLEGQRLPKRLNPKMNECFDHLP